MVICDKCKTQLSSQSIYTITNEGGLTMCRDCRQRSELTKRLVCSVCKVQLTSTQVIACGIPSDRLHNYLHYRCYRSSIHDPSFISDYFGILVCPTHSCDCTPRSQPSGNINPCNICKNKMVCQECEYRRCKNGILHTSVCKSCYDS